MHTFSHAELVKSPLNVRTNDEDANAVEALSASIVAEGLLEPLIVHTLPFEDLAAPDGVVAGVIAGARRLRAIGAAIARGDLRPDFPITADVRDGLNRGQLILLSLSENLLRRDLRAYETHAAIAAAAAAGLAPEQIASDTGQTMDFVRQQLRLGNLAPEIFERYTRGELTADQARAYAATEDHELQRAAWKHFTGSLAHSHSAHAIRAFMKVGDRELAAMLRFVGEQAYRDAGGRFELDLFAEEPEQRGRVVDEAKLRQLAETKLDGIRARVREERAAPDLRFAVEPPKYQGYVDSGLEILLEDGMALPAGDVVATLAIDPNGRAEARYWWASRNAKGTAKKTGAASGIATPPPQMRNRGEVGDDGAFNDYEGAQAARASLKDEHGLTADGLEVMRSLRRLLLRSVLLRNAAAGGTLGRDYLVWSQLRQEFGGDREHQAGARGIVRRHWGTSGPADDEPMDLIEDWLGDSQVKQDWEGLVADLRRAEFMQIEDPAESFATFVRLDRAQKSFAATVLASAALLRSVDAQGWRIPAHDKLAELAGATDAQLRRMWTPDAAFAGLFPKLKRLELAQPHVGTAEFKGWHKLDDKTLTGAVAGALEQADGWVHPLLSFNVPDEEPAGGEEEGEDPQDPNVNNETPAQQIEETVQ